MSHTISVKYIPNTTIDYFNTMINAVHAKGYLLTLHVETFSCRMSRADKQTFENQRKERHLTGNGSSGGGTPNNTYSNSATPQHRYEEDDGDFRFDNDPPPSSQSQQNAMFPNIETPPTTPPLSYLSPGSNITQGSQSGRPCFPEFFTFPTTVSGGMGVPQVSGTMGSVSVSGMGSYTLSGVLGLPPLDAPECNNSNVTPQPFIPTSAEEAYALSLQIINDRLVYLVGTLNSLYGTAEYDFSVLEPTDFILVNPTTFINEITGVLGQLPPEMHSYTGQNGEAFWRAIGAMIGGEISLYDFNTNMSDCDVFLLRCPQCDPMAQTKLWSNHYFIYNKKHRVMVSVLSFGDNYLYQGNHVGYCGAAAGAPGEVGVVSPDYAAIDSRGNYGHIPTEITNGEYYTDGYGNTHAIGDGYDDDAAAKRTLFQSRTPTEGESDTPQYTHTSMTDAQSDWGEM